MEPEPGDIDEVTLYSGVMNEAFFQQNLDRIVAIPEPSAALLWFMVIGVFVVAFRRRG